MFKRISIPSKKILNHIIVMLLTKKLLLDWLHYLARLSK